MANGKTVKADLVEQARQLRLQAEALEKKVSRELARGTQRGVRPPQNVIVKPAYGPYYVGDEGPTEQLLEVVKDMLTEKPMRFQEILDATGARDNRVKGVIMRLQREGVRVVDIAPPHTGKAVWFIPSDAVLQRLSRVKRATDRR
jgi:hypothetical protein